MNQKQQYIIFVLTRQFFQISCLVIEVVTGHECLQNKSFLLHHEIFGAGRPIYINCQKEAKYCYVNVIVVLQLISTLSDNTEENSDFDKHK